MAAPFSYEELRAGFGCIHLQDAHDDPRLCDTDFKVCVRAGGSRYLGLNCSSVPKDVLLAAHGTGLHLRAKSNRCVLPYAGIGLLGPTRTSSASVWMLVEDRVGLMSLSHAHRALQGSGKEPNQQHVEGSRGVQAAAGIGNLLEALHADGVMQLQLTHHSVLVVVRSNSMDCFLADLRCLPALELGSGPSGVAYAYCDLQSLAATTGSEAGLAAPELHSISSSSGAQGPGAQLRKALDTAAGLQSAPAALTVLLNSYQLGVIVLEFVLGRFDLHGYRSAGYPRTELMLALANVACVELRELLGECLHDTPANRCSLAFVLRHYCFWALNPTKVSAVLAWTGKHCRGGHMRDKLEAHLTEACEALRTSGGYYALFGDVPGPDQPPFPTVAEVTAWALQERLDRPIVAASMLSKPAAEQPTPLTGEPPTEANQCSAAATIFRQRNLDMHWLEGGRSGSAAFLRQSGLVQQHWGRDTEYPRLLEELAGLFMCRVFKAVHAVAVSTRSDPLAFLREPHVPSDCVLDLSAGADLLVWQHSQRVSSSAASLEPPTQYQQQALPPQGYGVSAGEAGGKFAGVTPCNTPSPQGQRSRHGSKWTSPLAGTRAVIAAALGAITRAVDTAGTQLFGSRASPMKASAQWQLWLQQEEELLREQEQQLLRQQEGQGQAAEAPQVEHAGLVQGHHHEGQQQQQVLPPQQLVAGLHAALGQDQQQQPVADVQHQQLQGEEAAVGQDQQQQPVVDVQHQQLQGEEAALGQDQQQQQPVADVQHQQLQGEEAAVGQDQQQQPVADVQHQQLQGEEAAVGQDQQQQPVADVQHQQLQGEEAAVGQHQQQQPVADVQHQQLQGEEAAVGQHQQLQPQPAVDVEPGQQVAVEAAAAAQQALAGPDRQEEHSDAGSPVRFRLVPAHTSVLPIILQLGACYLLDRPCIGGLPAQQGLSQLRPDWMLVTKDCELALEVAPLLSTLVHKLMSATDDLVYGHAEGAAAVRVCCRTITACLLARHLRSSAPRHIMQQCFTLVAYLHRCYPHYMVPGAGEQLLQELLVHRVMACFADGVRGLAGAAAGAEAELEAFAVGQCRKSWPDGMHEVFGHLSILVSCCKDMLAPAPPPAEAAAQLQHSIICGFGAQGVLGLMFSWKRADFQLWLQVMEPFDVYKLRTMAVPYVVRLYQPAPPVATLLAFMPEPFAVAATLGRHTVKVTSRIETWEDEAQAEAACREEHPAAYQPPA